MKIEGTIASSAAVSDQVLSAQGAQESQTRARVGHDAAQQDAYNNPSPTAIASEQRAVGAKLLSSAVEAIEKLLEETGGDMALRIQAKDRKLVVRVVDRKTGKVVREIPSETFLEMVNAVEREPLSDSARRPIAGLFVDQRQ